MDFACRHCLTDAPSAAGLVHILPFRAIYVNKNPSTRRPIFPPPTTKRPTVSRVD